MRDPLSAHNLISLQDTLVMQNSMTETVQSVSNFSVYWVVYYKKLGLDTGPELKGKNPFSFFLYF